MQILSNVFSFYLLMKTPQRIGSVWEIFVSEFSPMAWLFTCITIVTLAIFLYAITRFSPNEEIRMDLSQSFLVTIGALCSQSKFGYSALEICCSFCVLISNAKILCKPEVYRL